MDPEHSDELKALRAQYEATLGKRPFLGWNAAELRHRLADAADATDADRAAREEHAAADPRVRVIITCAHIYLPLDGEGNVPTDWRADMPTSRVERRARLLMPAEMAQSLSAQDRVEVL